MKLLSQSKSFKGWLKRYRHASTSVNADMNFAIYLPPQAESEPVPVLYWLSGLTCTEENFVQKAGAQRIASALGLALVCPDTSPRGTNLPGEDDSDYIGSGAGFYINATQAPWDQHYQMYDYIVDELPALIQQHFPVNDQQSISGHSMGGHGALTIALKNPERYCSVSALAPICNPSQSELGENIFKQYLGDDPQAWAQYDASLLVADAQQKLPLFIDQGDVDDLLQDMLKPDTLQAACEANHYPLTLRMQAGYDHSYFFVASFIEDHLRYHEAALRGKTEVAYY